MSFDFSTSDAPKLPVTPSKDLDRILTLPTRDEPHSLLGGLWSPTLNHLTPEQVTEAFKTPRGTWTLRPIQARTLVEAARARGVVGRVPTGRGKSLCSLLLPEAMQVRRAVLLVPAALLGSLQREIKKYEPHFRLGLDRIIKIMSHQELSLPRSTDLLEELAPDSFIVDEIDAFANHESVRTNRLLKYGRRHNLRWAFLSGTLFQKSVRDAVYWFALALRERSPLPLARSEIETWADVLDPLELGQKVRDPGAIRKLCRPGEDPRQAWNRRASATVGVVTSRDARLGVALYIHERPVVMPPVIKTALQELHKTWTRPDGREFSMALDLRRLERQITAGFYLRWVQEPEVEWLDARNGWARAVRQRLSAGVRRVGMDSPFLIECAAELGFRLKAGDLDSTALPNFESPEWVRWRVLKHIPEPDTEAVSLDPYLQDDAVAWGMEHVGIIWTLHEHTGMEIARRGAFPYFGAGDDRILDEKGDRTVVASIKAHGIGKNLQAFHEGLIVEQPASGKVIQQLLARLHRDGQESPQVDFWIYRHAPAYTRAWATAVRKARFMEPMNADDQKILHATLTFEDETERVDQAAIDAFSFVNEGMDEIAAEDEAEDSK